MYEYIYKRPEEIQSSDEKEEEEHLKLKDICDSIGYKEGFYTYEWHGGFFVDEIADDGSTNWLDVRGIIFTRGFMNPYIQYYKKTKGHQIDLEYFSKGLLSHLDDPVDYLYNYIHNNANNTDYTQSREG